MVAKASGSRGSVLLAAFGFAALCSACAPLAPRRRAYSELPMVERENVAVPALAMEAVTHCYATHPQVVRVNTRIELLVTTDGAGGVTSAETHGERLPLGLAGCLQQATRAWKFPQVKGGRVRVPLVRWSVNRVAAVATVHDRETTCFTPNLLWPCTKVGTSRAHVKVRVLFAPDGKPVATGVVASSSADEQLNGCFERVYLSCPTSPDADGAYFVQDFETSFEISPPRRKLTPPPREQPSTASRPRAADPRASPPTDERPRRRAADVVPAAHQATSAVRTNYDAVFIPLVVRLARLPLAEGGG